MQQVLYPAMSAHAVFAPLSFLCANRSDKFSICQSVIAWSLLVGLTATYIIFILVHTCQIQKT